MFYRRIIHGLLLSVLLFATSATAQVVQLNEVEQRLRAILQLEPGHDVARERLSVLLLQTGRTDAALYHARRLAKTAVSPDLRKQAAALVSRLEGPSWGWRPIFSVVPSSNLNKGATGDTIYVGDQAFTIDEDSRAKDGVGLTFGAATWKTWRPNETWRGTISGEASTTLYPDSDLETKQKLASALSFDRRFGRHTLGLGVSVDAQFEQGDLERRRITPFIQGSRALSADRRLSARLEWSDVHYPKETFRSGSMKRLTLGWHETVSPRTQLIFSLPLATERTRRPHLDNDSIGVGVRLSQLWGNGAVRTSLGMSHTVDSYIGTFPGTTLKRKDRVSTVSLEVSNSKLEVRGFVPKIRYEYTRSHSNVSLYDYDSHDVQVTFSKSF